MCLAVIISHSMHKTIKYLTFFVLLVSLILAALPMLRGTIYFHVDIARDFLLIEEIVHSHKFTLLGPRSGGIPGVFHGPLWLYLNVPAFILSGGNPVGVGFGWFVMWIAGLYVAWFAFKKIVDKKIAIISTTMYALLTCTSVSNSFNPTGAMLVAPIWFTYLLLYARGHNWRHLVTSFCALGLMIQFQMAFGIPAVILTCIYLISILMRTKRWHHFLTVLTIPPFISTFVVFDLRHDFLQTKAVLSYVFGSVRHGKSELSLLDFFLSRCVESMYKLFGFITQYNTFVLIAFTLLILWAVYRLLRNKSKVISSDILFLFVFMWFGYWILTLPYKGVMWDYYLLPFLPLSTVFLLLILQQLPRKYFHILLFIWITGMCLLQSVSVITRLNNATQVRGEWIFMKNAIEKTMFREVSPRKFGYFIFTLDQLGYDPDYALHYLARKYSNFEVKPTTKAGTTYLLQDTESHPRANKDYWRSVQVNINKKPDITYKINHTFQIEKYSLTEDEMKVPYDPNLLQNLIFR
jgi:hypothetical protein